jgi:hypothetical protein
MQHAIDAGDTRFDAYMTHQSDEGVDSCRTALKVS